MASKIFHDSQLGGWEKQKETLPLAVMIWNIEAFMKEALWEERKKQLSLQEALAHCLSF